MASTASPIHSRRVALGVSSMVSRGCILPLTAYARKFESEQHSLALMRPLWSPLPRGYRVLLLGKGGIPGLTSTRLLSVFAVLFHEGFGVLRYFLRR
jgi:hypothetical protein